MRGDLSVTPLPDLCRGLSEREATGMVALDGPEGSASIVLRRGRIADARSPAPRARLGDRLVNAALLTQEQLDDALARQATAAHRPKLGALLVSQGLVTRDVIRVFVQEQILDAVFDIMRWASGAYAFAPAEAVAESLPVDMPVDEMLVEVSRRQSEWDQIERTIPHLDMVPDFVSGGSSAAAALEPDEFAVLANVDGQRSIRDLADRLGYGEFEAARIVHGLTLLGVLEVADPDAAGIGVDDDISEPADAATDTVEAEFDLGDLAPAPADAASTSGSPPPDDTVDVGAALEEALATSSAPPPPHERPPVRVHLDEDRLTAPPEPAAAAWEQRDEDADDAVDRAGLGALLHELATSDRSDPLERPAPRRDGDADDAASAADRSDHGEAPTPRPPTPSSPPPTRGDGDVSEFLRELSRLAVDDDEEPAGSTPSDAPPPAREGRDPRSEGDQVDDRRKRGLFGWGR